MDPRNAPEAYFRSYFDQMDPSEARDGLKNEFFAVFGGYDEQRANEFIRELGLPALSAEGDQTDHDMQDGNAPESSAAHTGQGDPKGQGMNQTDHDMQDGNAPESSTAAHTGLGLPAPMGDGNEVNHPNDHSMDDENEVFGLAHPGVEHQNNISDAFDAYVNRSNTLLS